ncbi:MAG: polysaccharide deacetylase family protein [Candidatus Micrarchaeia archaeon]
MVSVGFSERTFLPTGMYNLTNTKFVKPTDSLQTAYDWLKSSGRDAQMGVLSATNQRYLLLTAGTYEDNLAIDTNFVNVKELVPYTVWVSGNWTVTAGIDTLPINTTKGSVYKYRNVKPIFIETADNLTGWQDSAAFCSPSLVTTSLCSTNITVAGLPQSVAFTIADEHTYASIDKTFSSPVDITGSQLVIRYKLETLPTAISFTFGDSAWNNYVVMRIARPTSLFSYAGWHEVSYTLTDALTATSGDLATALSSFQRCKIRVDGTAGTTFILDRIMFIPSMAKGFYSFTFDDGHKSNYRYAAYLSSKGIRGTFYVVPSLVGTTNYLSISELQEMQMAGHLIANHTFDHRYFSVLGDPMYTALQDYAWAANWLQTKGMATGSRIGAAPGGSGNWLNQYDQILDLGVLESIRLLEQYSTDTYLYPGSYDLSKIYAKHIIDNPGSASAAAALDRCETYKFPLISLFHPQLEGGTDFSWAQFTAHVDAVVAKRDAGTILVGTPLDLLKMTGVE